MKRLWLSLLAGAVCAAICAVGKLFLNPAITLPVLLASAVGNRLLLGFVIGISRLKMNYLRHGALIGLLVSLSYSIGTLAEKNLEGFVIYTMVGVVYGVVIELFVTKGCKACVVIQG